MREIVVDTVKLVIEVPKEVYEKQQYSQYFGAWSTVLQKHFENGKLISADILDKIRAEIEAKIVKRPWLNFVDRERDRNDAFLEALDIIDKYKAESENKE